MAATYRWKPEARVRVDAQAAGEELERIRTRHNGRLEAKDVVEAARSPDTPLHPHFEWDDADAAEQWRLGQASYLIRSIVIEQEPPDEGRAPLRAFVSVKRDEDRSYTSVQHALSDPDLRRQIVEQAWIELEAWQRRHAELIELAHVFTAIDQARPA